MEVGIEISFFLSASTLFNDSSALRFMFVSFVQVSRWKRRAEEPEGLQRVVSSPEGFAFDSSTSETEPSVSPGTSGLPFAALDPVTTPERNQQEERHELEEAQREAVTTSLREELSEVKETLAMMEEELATAVLAAREHGVQRAAAESRVKSLQVRKISRVEREGRKFKIMMRVLVTYLIFLRAKLKPCRETTINLLSTAAQPTGPGWCGEGRCGR